MDSIVKALWIEYLRDPKNSRTTKALKNIEGECPLGALCSVYSKVQGGEWIEMGGGRIFFMEQNLCLPDAVVKWAGLKSVDPKIFYQDLPHHLKLMVHIEMDEDYILITELNDKFNFTFSEIAEVVEKCL